MIQTTSINGARSLVKSKQNKSRQLRVGCANGATSSRGLSFAKIGFCSFLMLMIWSHGEVNFSFVSNALRLRTRSGIPGVAMRAEEEQASPAEAEEVMNIKRISQKTSTRNLAIYLSQVMPQEITIDAMGKPATATALKACATAVKTRQWQEKVEKEALSEEAVLALIPSWDRAEAFNATTGKTEPITVMKLEFKVAELGEVAKKEPLKAGASVNVGKLAGAIVGQIKEHKTATIYAAGSPALSVLLKAMVVATGYLQNDRPASRVAATAKWRTEIKPGAEKERPTGGEDASWDSVLSTPSDAPAIDSLEVTCFLHQG